MKKILNGLFYFLKFFFFFGALSFTLIIIIQMYQRLEKNIVDSFNVFVPYLLILILFIINFSFKQKNVTNNIFYNLTCCLVFATIMLVGFRAMFDANMVLRAQLGKNINFNFFDYFIPFMKIMLYGLSIANLFLMFSERNKTKKIAEQVL